jgi:two-component system LytT family response regulator
VIVDDEPLARSNLLVLLRRDPDIEVVDECGSGMQAVASIREKKPDLVFLDVQMPECDGFDVLELLGSDVPPVVLFVTAYDQYALRAFEAGALDYVLKPFDNARFARALARAKDRLANRGTQPSPDRLVVKNAGEVSFIRIAEIDWIEAADYYVCLHVGRRTHLLRRSMSELEGALGSFCRIHRSAMVNLDRVRTLTLNQEGEYDVLLEDGTALRLSRRYRKLLQSRLGVRASKP